MKKPKCVLNGFRLAGMTLPGVPDPSIAVAASRAGGVGILDIEYISSTDNALKAVRDLGRFGGENCGVRLRSTDRQLFDAVAAELRNFKNINMVLLAHEPGEAISAMIDSCRSLDLCVMLEVTSFEEAKSACDLGIDGFVLKGNEASGFVGEKTSFILLQQMSQHFDLPLWIQGGIGLHTAAACVAAGAKGLVLDFQLALTRESHLPEDVKSHIRRMDGSEAQLAGDGNSFFRFFRRPGTAIDERILLGPKAAVDADSSNAIRDVDEWREFIRRRVSWDAEEQSLWPMSQDAANAVHMGVRFGSVGAVFRALEKSICEHIDAAKSMEVFGENSPLAVAHGTKYPIVQGPMARISDNVGFITDVAEGGALPFFAVSMMSPDEIRSSLGELRKCMGGMPWGVGLLGFNESELYDAQVKAVAPFAPGFAIIAGGRPAQVQALESMGIASYVHIPSPALLDIFIDAGATRFVFEGNECGGHIGPRTSFVLWEGMIEKLLERFRGGSNPEDFSILFAGGIHDSLSAAMTACMAAPLASRGVKTGIVMGTAYLLTKEIVETHAILEGYQSSVLTCTETKVLESSPGHSVRCCNTHFVEEFHRKKRELVMERRPSGEVRATLDRLIMGRLRIAARGMDKNPAYGSGTEEPYLVPVSTDFQQREGVFMVGQVAALHPRPLTIDELHLDVVEGACHRLNTMNMPDQEIEMLSAKPATPSNIAIVGMACLFPKAKDLRTYWGNILGKVDAITEIPENRWDWQLYFDSNKEARDKIYSRWGGFLEDVPFDPVRYGIPPNALESVEPLQLLSLEVVSAALRDAGYENREFARERTSVIFGTGSGIGDVGQKYVMRAGLPTLFNMDSDDVLGRLNEWTEDSFPGILMNVLSGRVANRFNLCGVNYTVDSACASSLTAIYDAIRELESGSSDMAIAGGVDAGQSPFIYTCFSKTSALSSTGKCRVFDEGADGTVISEGLAVLVLKRLADAERDGDRIYAVIKSVCGSSDGRALGLTAPRPEGQILALKRAYEKAGFSPATVALFEAHGTGTVVGDQVEAGSLMRLLTEEKAAAQSCAIGSVKSMIGHTKGAAGLAGVIKATLSLYHKLLPPTMGVERPNPKIDFQGGPLYLNTEVRPWIGNVDNPRRAGVSAFGFGGTNFHAVLEEYAGGLVSDSQIAVMDQWPGELLLWAGRSGNDIVSAIDALQKGLDEGAQPRLCDLAYSLCMIFQGKERDRDAAAFRLAIVASSLEDMREKLVLSRKLLTQDMRESISDPRGIYFSGGRPAEQGKVAFLFPGQGSQYPNMLKDLAVFFPEVRDCFEQADAVLNNRFPERLSSHIFPPQAFTPQQEGSQRRNLSRPDIAQPALGAASCAMLRLLQRLALHPDMVAGHSYGEYVALSAAGVYGEEALYAISESRGRFILEASAGSDMGSMAAVRAGESALREILGEADDVVLANMNSPSQTVISGGSEAIDRAIDLLASKDIQAMRIPVACAFHSRFMSPAKKPLADYLQTVEFASPRLEVFSNTHAAPYGGEAEEIRSCLSEHLVRPVEFRREIEAMYESGARFFVEVGPGGVLTNLTRQILDGKSFLAISTNMQGESALEQFLRSIAQLVVAHLPVSLQLLYRGRDLKPVDFDNLKEDKSARYSPTTWLINGSGVAKPDRKWKKRGGQGSPGVYRARERRLPNETEGGEVLKSFSLDETRRARVTDQTDAGCPETLSAQAKDTPMPGGDIDADAVMVQYQQLMAQFLETQKIVMTAYLEGSAPYPRTSSSTAVNGLEVHRGRERAGEPAVDAVLADGRTRAQDARRANTVSPSTDETALASLNPDMGESQEKRLRAGLLSITSERTGYPADMLNLDSDMEADLGIDSIKRVEIVGAFVKRLSAEEQSRVKAVMEDLTRSKTLRAILDKAVEVVVSARVGPGAIADACEAETSPSGNVHGQKSRRERFKDGLLSITSERTGYPADMLNLDSDMEADLGIDSIKRVEIVGAFVKRLSVEEQSRVKAVMEDLTRSKTLRAILDRVDEVAVGCLAEEKDGPAKEKLVGVGTRDDNAGGPPVPRFIIESVASPVSENGSKIRQKGTFILTDDGRGVAFALADELRQRGGNSVILRHGGAILGHDDRARSVDLSDPLSVDSVIEEIRMKNGPIAGLIHLLPLGSTISVDSMGLQEWRDRLKVETKGFFYLARTLREDLKNPENGCAKWLMAATTAANTGAGGSISCQAGISGLIKTAAQEWPDVACRAVHLDTTNPPVVLANQVLAEMLTHEAPAEVAYRGTERLVFRAREAHLDKAAEHIRIDGDCIILVTGGAAGITAELAKKLAMQYKPTLIIVGRSTPPEDDEAPETASLASPQEIKSALIERLRASGGNLSPAVVEAKCNRLLKDREIRANIAQMQDAGATVRYFQVDVRDEAAMGNLLEEIHGKFGRLDGVIHGAGIIEDKLLEDKTPESFDRVFDTKVDSAFILSRAIRRHPVRFAVFFTSVSGCFGNRGQSDYAAANNLVNELAIDLDRKIDGRVVAMNWGPWKKLGMVRPELERQFKERGIQLIPPEVGTELADDELRFGEKGDVEVVFGDGPWRT